MERQDDIWAASLQVMKHGSTNATLKRSGKVHNERLQIPHDQKKIPSVQIKSKTILLTFFFILEGLFIMDLYQLDSQPSLLFGSNGKAAWKIRRKWPEHFTINSRILHHDSAPAHAALSVREFLATKQITVLEHPVSSPDLTPSNFYLFPKIKEILKGRHFDDTDDIRCNTTASLKVILQNHFQKLFWRVD